VNYTVLQLHLTAKENKSSLSKNLAYVCLSILQLHSEAEEKEKAHNVLSFNRLVSIDLSTQPVGSRLCGNEQEQDGRSQRSPATTVKRTPPACTLIRAHPQRNLTSIKIALSLK